MDDRTDLTAFLDDLGDHCAGQSISSPFGAWLVLAATGRLQVADLDRAGALLDSVPAGLKAAVAAWGDPGVGPFSFFVERGPLPSKSTADAWAKEHTDEMIKEFPGEIPPAIPGAFLLASAIMGRTSWPEPLPEVSSLQLGGSFAGRVARCLLVSETHHQISLCADGPDLFVVVSTHGTNGITVHSVLAPDHWSPTTAQQVARRVAAGQAHHAVRDSDDWARAARELPGVTRTPISHARGDVTRAYLPAWEANTLIKLADAPYFRDRGEEALQVAYAKFDTTGFEAAAITAVAAGSAPMPASETFHLHLARFARPYAFAASWRGDGPWDRVPLFEGWVTDEILKEPEPVGHALS